MRMMLAALALLVGGCGGAAEDPTGNQAGAGTMEPAATGSAGRAVATARLTGLWQGDGAGRPNQLCMIDEGTGSTEFGLVVWGEAMHSCSGAGTAVREEDGVILRMEGDDSCEIRAAIDGDRIVLPASVPEGCGYYCGARARLTGASFTRAGSTAADAMKATDLVGEPLCENAR